MNSDFSKENVETLNALQNSNYFHPYTCNGHGIDCCKREQAYAARQSGNDVPYTPENEGVLVATENGWVCPCGKYTQSWF